MKYFLIIFPVLAIIACRGISTLHDYPEGRGLKSLASSEEVYLTSAKDTGGCKITRIADVRVSSKTYGGASRVNAALRKLARQKGGNAVLDYSFWVAPNGGAWAAPHCKGMVVSADLNCLKMHTEPVPGSE
ncbi:MAG TPA: hypothetical protein PKA63_11885 [Oligoflexia bacterium]|nr:hypothetical protein [Oligoflexia bacterium]HMP49354.1 hypothetical protein [Oligoflexia bacterium]